MKRYLEPVLSQHYSTHNEAIFLSGPRQVGKTTIAMNLQKEFALSMYLSWDDRADREKILRYEIPLISSQYAFNPLIIFDEIHKFKDWKGYLKGLFDKHNKTHAFLVTGSSHLNVYRKGGDSMMGRYFLYRTHPISVGELCSIEPIDSITRAPRALERDVFEQLLRFGGFPKPFLSGEQRFYNRWVNQRFERLFEEDLRDALHVREIQKIQILGTILQSQAGQSVGYSSLSRLIQVSDQTIRAWVANLEAFYFCFLIRPWSSNVMRSLIKEPKVYMWDWSVVKDIRQRNENFIASHLLKAVHFWTDHGFGVFDLYYLRDKEQNEVDFLVSKDGEPWILVEVKTSAKEPLSKSLYHFQAQVRAPHIFQVVIDMPYKDIDCFATLYEPMVIPASTFLSQLI